MDLATFQGLPTADVADIVRARGPKVCVFPINGTRRWFTLEYGDQTWDDPLAAYMDIAGERHIDLYRMFFEHGVSTLLTPAFGPDMLLRGDEYMRRVGAEGLVRLAEHPAFVRFYEEYDVRVHFYGDHRRHLQGSDLAHVSERFEAAEARTRTHSRFRLFFGIFANDATASVADFSARFFQAHGRIPEKKEMIEMYYGEYVEPVDVFIGFDRFSAFDMPLLATGEEDLYFTVSPSPYMDPQQLRHILHDHIYKRPSPEPEYSDLTADALQEIRSFYATHRGHTLGTGTLLHGIWIPETCD